MKVGVERFGYIKLLQDFRYLNYTFYEFKILKKVITIETFNVDFHNKFNKIWIFLLFQLFFISDSFKPSPCKKKKKVWPSFCINPQTSILKYNVSVP